MVFVFSEYPFCGPLGKRLVSILGKIQDFRIV